MPKATDIPSELRQFNKIFERIAYRWDYSTVFDDYLTYCIEVFDLDKTGEPVQQMKKKYGELYEVFIELFHEHIQVMHKMLQVEGWYDLLGTFYENLRSRSKASALGQFFTPKPICDFMAGINGVEDEKGKWMRINDCACGSGRTLLAWQAVAPGNFLYGEDLDPMCAKMCAINLTIHAAVGQVCCMDSLWPDKWYFGFDINPLLYPSGVIGLKRIKKEESFSYTSMQMRITNNKEPPIPVVKASQLTLFDDGTQ